MYLYDSPVDYAYALARTLTNEIGAVMIILDSDEMALNRNGL